MGCRRFQGMQIVFRRIVRSDNQFYAVFIDQIFILLFHKSDNDVNLCNADFMKLTDCALNQPLSFDFQKSFRCLCINRNHPHTKSGGKDDRVFRRFFFCFIQRFFRWADLFIQVSFRNQLFDRTINDTKRMAGLRGEDALIDEWFFH